MDNIIDYEFTDYSFNFVKPVRLQGQIFEKRNGCFVEVFTDFQDYLIELSPLFSVHSESLEEAKKQLEGVLKSHLNRPLSELKNYLFHNPKDLFPSVSFSLSQIFEDEIFETVNELIIPKEVGLIDLTKENEIEENKNYKLKLARLEFNEEIEALKKLKPKLKSARLRLDPNQNISLKDLTTVIETLGEDSIEFIEEPFKEKSDLISLKQLFPNIKIALDESMWDKEFSDIPAYCDYLIIKPTRFYSLSYLKSILDNTKCEVILSSCYESARTLKSFQKIISYYSYKNEMGFGSYEWINDKAYPVFNLKEFKLGKNHLLKKIN